jgi:hypothetical protein
MAVDATLASELLAEVESQRLLLAGRMATTTLLLVCTERIGQRLGDLHFA